jgi:hypothetical protein
LPIARLQWKRGAGLEWLYPPTFRDGYIQGGRVEFEATLPGGTHAGFVHLQAAYDLIEPYATIKAWMNARQEGRSWREQVRFVARLLRDAPRMARIGYDRLFHRRLFVPDGMELTVVMDFESCASPRNRLTFENGEHRLYWDVRDEDVAAFAVLRTQGLALIQRWARECRLDLRVLAVGEDIDTQGAYLRSHATDAYHLGGGLALNRDPREGLLAPDLRFHRLRNWAVISTAAFSRPGIANPVETLLAMCEEYVGSLDAS